MNKHDSVEKVVAKLHVLRDSCSGVLNSERTNQHLLWFQGAEAMLIKAVDDLQRALNALKSGEAEEIFAAEKIEEKASAEKPEVEEGPETKH